MGRKTSYTAKTAKGWKMSWHYDGPFGKTLCGRSANNSTDNIELVDCISCLKKMVEKGYINEETYKSKLCSSKGQTESTVQVL